MALKITENGRKMYEVKIPKKEKNMITGIKGRNKMFAIGATKENLPNL